MLQPRLNVDDLPDSPYAQELRRWPRLTFDPALEADYRQAHLDRVRLRAGLWASLLFVLALAFAADRLDDDGAMTAAVLAHLALLFAGGALVWIAWTDHYARWYLPAARVLAPILHALAGVFVAASLARGAAENSALLVLAALSAFFFAGLPWRAAVVTCGVALAAFVAAAGALGVRNELLLDASGALVVGAALAGLIARELELALRKRFLQDGMIAELLERDALTGLKNRHAFEEKGRAAWQVAERDRQPLAILLIDVDYFKRYNDEYGHEAGDAVLQQVAAVVRGMGRRPLDVAARFGGEELVVALYGTGPAAAGELGDDLRRRVEALRIEHRASLCGTPFVTVTVGAAVVTPEAERSFEGALELAARALRRAKDAGRNRVIVESGNAYEDLVTGGDEDIGAVANG